MGIRSLVVAALVAGAFNTARAETTPPSDLTIKATAPLALNEAELGRPFSDRFEPVVGKEGRTLFAGAKTKRTEVNSSWYTFQAIDSSHELRANARAWIIDVSVASTAETRYAVYRVVQLTHAIEINDTEDPRTVGGDAAYYLRKIYYGRVYELVFSGRAESFTTDVRAQLLVESALANFQKKHRNVQTQVFARGLQPKVDALFAKTPKEIRDAYVEDKQYNAGKPVPVLVEYRRIPGAKLDGYQDIEWKQPSAAVRS